MIKLMTCPFCGSGDVGGASGIVSCYICGVETCKHPDTELACLSWNNRANPITTDKCIEHLQLNIENITQEQSDEIEKFHNTVKCHLFDDSDNSEEHY